jgi:major membrane immunogen (membrane-anchored lipoprotein)
MKKLFTFILAASLTLAMLTGCGTQTPTSTEEKDPVQTTGKENAPAENTEDLTAEEKPEPIYGNQIKDGTYQIEVSSSSSMFRIIDAQLTIADGKMSAVITLNGKGYEKLYMGTGEEALADTDDKCIYYVEDNESKYTYEVPVAALNQDIDCAAWSIRKQEWYDRVLVFQSSTIPEEAMAEVAVSDGRYTSEVILSGGSGRAKVESPAELSVESGTITATVIWSSPNYEYMLIDGTYYYPINTTGNSTFEIPVSMDKDIDITAQTVAMSTPHEIDYTLRFDSATLTSK